MVALAVLTGVLYLGGFVLFFFRMRSVASKLDARAETTMTTGLSLAFIIPFGLGISGGAMLFGSQNAAATVAVLSAVSIFVGFLLIPSSLLSGIERLKAREKEECNERFNELMRQRVEERKQRAIAREPSNQQLQPTANAPAE